jgi:hypothetical protein
MYSSPGYNSGFSPNRAAAKGGNFDKLNKLSDKLNVINVIHAFKNNISLP